MHHEIQGEPTRPPVSSDKLFKTLFKVIKDSDTMNMDVFFAITICIKINVKKHEKEVGSLTTKQKVKFFEDKTKAFFDSIKFSQADYNNFMNEHAQEIQSYIDMHPEFRPYLNTFN